MSDSVRSMPKVVLSKVDGQGSWLSCCIGHWSLYGEAIDHGFVPDEIPKANTLSCNMAAAQPGLGCRGIATSHCWKYNVLSIPSVGMGRAARSKEGTRADPSPSWGT